MEQVVRAEPALFAADLRSAMDEAVRPNFLRANPDKLVYNG